MFGKSNNFEVQVTPENSIEISESEKATLSGLERLKQIADDPQAVEALKACARTCTNIGISIIDVIPGGIGESVSWVADLGKFWKKTNILTPDVSKVEAIGSEAGEFVSGGFFPSHVVETVRQLQADIPRLKEGLKRIKQIWREELDDYEVHREEIDTAINVFQ